MLRTFRPWAIPCGGRPPATALLAASRPRWSIRLVPADWPNERDWPADIAFSLVQADLPRGKSIGFLPTTVHRPSKDEKAQPGWHEVETVIDEWLLLEYACTFQLIKPTRNASRSRVS
jgi:hypothetical protein